MIAVNTVFILSILWNGRLIIDASNLEGSHHLTSASSQNSTDVSVISDAKPGRKRLGDEKDTEFVYDVRAELGADGSMHIKPATGVNNQETWLSPVLGDGAILAVPPPQPFNNPSENHESTNIQLQTNQTVNLSNRLMHKFTLFYSIIFTAIFCIFL